MKVKANIIRARNYSNRFLFGLYVLLMGSTSCWSQDLYVGQNSYLYVKDVPIFVNNDIRLEDADSYIYLRGDGQLLQNNDIKNSDLGSLSVYQETTTNIYEYNYWCSPVGTGTDGTQGNVNFTAGLNIFDPDDDADLTNVLSTPYAFTPGLDATVAALSSYWIYTLIEAEGYNGWVHIGETNPVSPGYGFTMKGYPSPPPPAPPASNTLDFRGRPNNGTFTVGLNYDGVDDEPASEPVNAVSTLMGNPYPSALDMKLFMNNNIALTDGNAYYWDQEPTGTHILTAYQGGYATYTPGNPAVPGDNGTYTPATFIFYDGFGGPGGAAGGIPSDFSANNARRYAAIGQGFILNSAGAGGNVIFDNSMRLYLPEDSTETGNGSVFRNAEDENDLVAMSHNGIDYASLIQNPVIIPDIRIHTKINDTYYRENVIAHREGMGLGYNKFTDGLHSYGLEDDVFLLSDGLPVVIKSVEITEQTRIPLAIRASNNGSIFEITVHAFNNFEPRPEVYIYDNLFQTYTNIKESIFSITLDQGEHYDRFEITFSTTDTLSDIEEEILQLKLYQDNSSQQFIVVNPTLLDVRALKMYDMAGKKVMDFNLFSQESYEFSTSELSDGIYLAALSIAGRQAVNKKVIIRN